MTFDITAKIVDIPKYENGQISGLMLRESLDNGSKMVMLADGWLKYGENVRAVYRTGKNQDAETSFFRKADGSVLDNAGSQIHLKKKRWSSTTYENAENWKHDNIIRFR